jgi:hypothetical protein
VTLVALAGMLFVLRARPGGVAGAGGFAQRHLSRVRSDAPPAALSAGSRAARPGGHCWIALR